MKAVSVNDKLGKKKKECRNTPCSVTMGLDVFAKSIDSCQPAQFAQADMSRNVSLSLHFVRVKKPFYIML